MRLTGTGYRPRLLDTYKLRLRIFRVLQISCEETQWRILTRICNLLWSSSGLEERKTCWILLYFFRNYFYNMCWVKVPEWQQTACCFAHCISRHLRTRHQIWWLARTCRRRQIWCMESYWQELGAAPASICPHQWKSLKNQQQSTPTKNN